MVEPTLPHIGGAGVVVGVLVVDLEFVNVLEHHPPLVVAGSGRHINAERRSSALVPQPRPWTKSFLLTGSASAARRTVVIITGVVFAAGRLSPLPPARWPPHPPTWTAASEDARVCRPVGGTRSSRRRDAEVDVDVVRSHGRGGTASAAGLVPFSPLVSLPPAAAPRPFS
uniref:Uncharacterized protein n=1 Tax=Oryza sativa subsp. japonica TaxID=39947 RepID=Q6ZGT7_ORYSJ|nr:hypothetical protein [Oryza sativa Japonica Group]